MKPEIKERIERIRKGEVPEGYKATKVGIIPEEWDVVSLSKIVCDFITGGTPSTSNLEYWNGVIPWTRSAALTKKILCEGEKFISQEGLKNSASKIVPKNNVLLASRVSVGNVAINTIDVAISQDLTGLVINKQNASEEFVYWILLWSNVRMQTLVQGSTIQGLSQKDIKQFKIPFPRLEQQKIAEILSTWDKAIELKEKLIEEKKEFKRGLMQKLIAGNLRFSEFTDEWDEKKIGEICEIKKGTQINKTELSFKGKYAVLNGGISPSGYTTEWNTKENTITISEGGNSCGFVNFNKDKIWCGGHCYALTNVKINNLLLYHFLKYVEKKIMLLRVGSGLPNIQKKDVINFRLQIPKNVKEQEKIAQILDLISIEIMTFINDLNQLKEQKRGLMQLLLTGIVRVEVD
ncbi:MAG: restriction endonuclease subunit S [Methanosarcinaceae archaeon]|nr:restriction endonuclease subunit S [Methanosarcinaceae archaeon]